MLSNIFLSLAKEEEPAADDATPDLNVSAMKNVFRPGEEMNVYFEVYNLSLNPEKGVCDFTIEFLFFREGKLLTKVPLSTQEYTEKRDYRINTSFRLKNFKPGEYALRAKVVDLNSGKTTSRETIFIVTH